MSDQRMLLAIIPARGGSQALPGKNLRPFAGLPLMAHSVLFAKMCPEITRCVVSTDAPAIAEVARQYAADVPFMRPAALAQDDTPLWDVVRHALQTIETQEPCRYDLVLLLDPTSPAREPADVTTALQRLSQCPDADGIIGVSQPFFNPLWNCVRERDGWMADVFESGSAYQVRQEAPAVYRINGSLYLWRATFVREHAPSWRQGGRYLMHAIPERRAMSIDTLEQFEHAECLVTSGHVVFPWLSTREAPCAR